MKGTTNAQRNAIVDSTSAVDSLTLTKADGTIQQHKVSEMIPTDSEPTSGSSKFVTSGGVYNAISTVNSSISSLQSQVASKQEALTFDSTPTENSTNPVTSGGVYSAINTVQSAVASKQDQLTFDSTPTENSQNPVTSGGVFSAINNSASTGGRVFVQLNEPRDAKPGDIWIRTGAYE